LGEEGYRPVVDTKGTLSGRGGRAGRGEARVREETGFVPVGPFIELGAFRQPSRKVISVWAVENDFDLIAFRSNMFSMEWPPKSGRMREFPEADRAQWFSVDEARHKITKGQIPIVDALAQRFQ